MTKQGTNSGGEDIPKLIPSSFLSTMALIVLGTVGITSVIGVAYYGTRVDEAEALYVSLDESCVRVEERLGPNFADDEDLLELALQKFPDNMCAWYKNGVFELDRAVDASGSLRTRYLEDAVEHLIIAYGIKDCYSARYQLGNALAMLGRFNEAKHHLAIALSFTAGASYGGIDEQIAITASWLSYVSFVQRDKRDLLKYSQIGLNRNEGYPSSHTYRGMALLWDGKNEEARQEFLASKEAFEKAEIDDKEIYGGKFAVHNSWVRYRHLIMDYHGLEVIADMEAVPLKERGNLSEHKKQLIEESLKSSYLTTADISAIVENNPPAN